MVLAHISGANYYSVGQKTTIGLFHHNLEIPLAVFGYVDSVITISNCQAPLITLEELAREGKPADSSVSSPGIIPYTSHNEAFFGLALPLFDLIGKVSDLANRRKDRVDEVSELWFRQSATKIERDLRDWEPHMAQETTDRNSRGLANAAYAIK
jgi:hypothetical protein